MSLDLWSSDSMQVPVLCDQELNDEIDRVKNDIRVTLHAYEATGDPEYDRELTDLGEYLMALEHQKQEEDAWYAQTMWESMMVYHDDMLWGDIDDD